MSCASTSGSTMMMSERPKSERGSTRLNQRRWLSPGAAGWRGHAAAGRSIGLEDIAGAAHGLQIAREFGIALDLAAQPRHLDVDGPHIAAELRLLRERLARHGLAGAARQRQKQRHLGGGQMHELAAAIELAASQIEAEGAEAELAGDGARLRHALQDVADAQHQLARLEGLADVVVGAALKAVDAILGLGHRRQQEDWDAALPAQRAREIEATLARHHDVEDQEIEREALQLGASLGGVGGGRHAKALFGEI